MKEKAIYFPRLDNLRFFAFFLVFWQHGFASSYTKPEWMNKEVFLSLTYTGGMGVQIFFVLSGFLITFLLFKEKEKNGSINIRNFYLRRILRIWPVYYVVLLLGIFLLPTIASAFHYCGSIVLDLLFLNNLNAEAVCNSPNINIAWSVAIEEQFYLVWPLLFFLFAKNIKFLLILCVGLLVASGIYTMNYPSEAYFSTLGNVLYLMTGCAGAIFHKEWGHQFQIEKWFGKSQIILVLLMTFVLVFFKSVISLWVLPFVYLYFIVFSIQSEIHENKLKPFTYLGKYTYGMYMYHPMLIITVKIVFDLVGINYLENGLAHFIMACLSLLLTILLSIFSYEFLEKKILRLKNNYSTVQTRV